MPGLLSMYVGPLGGGKTTRAAWKVAWFKQDYPWVPIISNVPIEGAIYIPDVVRFLAVKFIKEGGKPGSQRTYMLVIIDEANSVGFESRGSGFDPGDTMLLQFARKLKVDIDVISQLLSMVDKRGQWLAAFYVLCRAVMENDKPAQFEYKIYNEALEYQKTEYLNGDFAQKWIFPTFDTYDIPNYDELALQLIKDKKIKSDDLEEYDRIVKHYGNVSPVRPQDRWLATRWGNFWDNAETVAQHPIFEPRVVQSEMPRLQPKSIPNTASGKSPSDLLRG